MKNRYMKSILACTLSLAIAATNVQVPFNVQAANRTQPIIEESNEEEDITTADQTTSDKMEKIKIDKEHSIYLLPMSGTYIESSEKIQVSQSLTLKDIWASVPEDHNDDTAVKLEIEQIQSAQATDIRAFYEEQLSIADENKIPIVITLKTETQAEYQDATALLSDVWIARMFAEHESLQGIQFFDYNWTTYIGAANMAKEYLEEIAKADGYLLWEEGEVDKFQELMKSEAFSKAVDTYKDNIVFIKEQLDQETEFLVGNRYEPMDTSVQATVEVDNVVLDQTSAKMKIGDQKTLKATLTPANATNNTVNWETSDKNIATVANGMVTAINVGTVIIKAISNNGKTASCTITIEKPDYTIADGKWMQDSKGYYYEFPDKSFLKNCWAEIDGKWYYFGESGYRTTSWLQIGGKWYYFDEAGKMATSWLQIDGKWYFFEKNGVRTTDWKKIYGQWYYFNVDGVMQTDWVKVGAKWYYFESNGYMKTGWLDKNNKRYYLDESGAMVTGWKNFGLTGILKLAYEQLGYEEKATNASLDSKKDNAGSGNYTKYARDLTNAGLAGYQGQPWCGVYQMWLEYKTYGASTALQHLGNTFYSCFGTKSWAMTNKKWITNTGTPQVGDCVIFSQSHIARVTGVTGSYYNGTIFTNEGNTGDGLEVDRDGGKVAAKSYARNNPAILGYVSIDHGSVESQWNKEGTTSYYFNSDGSMATEWVKSDSDWYYMGSDGKMKTGWQQVGKDWYFLDGEGKRASGWFKSNGKWYYLKSDGVMATGVERIDGKTYCFNAKGERISGWYKIDGKWYFANSSQAAVTGWAKVKGVWYYFDNAGVMQTGWKKIGSKWYYMNADGAMRTNWNKIDGKWYYLNGSGAMVTGWSKISNVWYYFNNSGHMLVDWQKIGGKWYYMKSSGAMVTGWYKIGNKKNYFLPSGVWTGKTA